MRQGDDDVDLVRGFLFGDAPAARGFERDGALYGQADVVVGIDDEALCT